MRAILAPSRSGPFESSTGRRARRAGTATTRRRCIPSGPTRPSPTGTSRSRRNRCRMRRCVGRGGASPTSWARRGRDRRGRRGRRGTPRDRRRRPHDPHRRSRRRRARRESRLREPAGDAPPVRTTLLPRRLRSSDIASAAGRGWRLLRASCACATDVVADDPRRRAAPSVHGETPTHRGEPRRPSRPLRRSAPRPGGADVYPEPRLASKFDCTATAVGRSSVLIRLGGRRIVQSVATDSDYPGHGRSGRIHIGRFFFRQTADGSSFARPRPSSRTEASSAASGRTDRSARAQQR
jgi:hypothetical protein